MKKLSRALETVRKKNSGAIAVIVHKGTRRLETERLTLRKFAKSDSDAMFENWAGDSEVTRFLSWQPHKNRRESARTIARWMRSYRSQETYNWAIVLKETGEAVGSIGVVGWNDAIGCMTVGYCLSRRLWHKGYTSEALGAVTAYLINDVGASRVEARHDPMNPNSGGVMKKCGFTYEGTLRKAGLSNRGITDVCMYSLLSEELER